MPEEEPPDLTPEEFEEFMRGGASARPCYTGKQVRARLQALEAEWERKGGFDVAYMRKFLEQLNAADPGQM